MTGPDLDNDLEAIGRRLSPRLGHAHDAVVSRATSGADGPRRPRPPWLGLHRLGGPAVTLAVAAGFAAVLAVGVASPRGGSTPSGSGATGPAVALATDTALPSTTPGLSTGTAAATPSGATSVAPPVEETPPARQPQTVTPAGPTPGSPTPPAPATGTRPPAPGPGRSVPRGPWGAPDPGEAAQPTPGPGPAGSDPTPGPRYQGTPIAPSPSPSPRPATIVLTAQDGGRTITVHAGDVVEVDLAAPGGGATWTEPFSTDGQVLQRTSGGTSKDGSAHAVFTATRSGTAQIQASKVPACANATPRCLPPQRIDFQVTVDVAKGG